MKNDETDLVLFGSFLATGTAYDYYQRLLKEAGACLNGISNIINQRYTPRDRVSAAVHMARMLILCDTIASRYGLRDEIKALIRGYRQEANTYIMKYGNPGDKKPGAPDEAETGTPDAKKTGAPARKKHGTPGTKKTGSPGTKKTGSPGTKKVGTPGEKK